MKCKNKNSQHENPEYRFLTSGSDWAKGVLRVQTSSEVPFTKLSGILSEEILKFDYVKVYL